MSVSPTAVTFHFCSWFWVQSISKDIFKTFIFSVNFYVELTDPKLWVLEIQLFFFFLLLSCTRKDLKKKKRTENFNYSLLASVCLLHQQLLPVSKVWFCRNVGQLVSGDAVQTVVNWCPAKRLQFLTQRLVSRRSFSVDLHFSFWNIFFLLQLKYQQIPLRRNLSWNKVLSRRK